VREVVLPSTVTTIEFCGAWPVVMMPLSSNMLICSVASGRTLVEPPTNDSEMRGPVSSPAGGTPGRTSSGRSPTPSVVPELADCPWT
jgi:hypothetical protein